MNRAGAVAGAAAVTLLLAGCGLSIPADPEGTLDRVIEGTLRVGATENDPWVVLDADTAPGGVEADLVERFAQQLDADISWSTGSEDHLVTRLERGELDLVIGGMPSDTPWSSRAAMTQPYAEGEDEHGEPIDRIMLVRRGENAFLLELDRFLQRQPEVNP